nr:hypothetical transcript [Hymenolepis microstoma]
MSEARIIKFDDSIFDILSDVSSSDVEQESIANSSIIAAENNKRLEDVQIDFNGNSSQIEESLSITTPPRRALKRRRKGFKEFEGMMRDRSIARWWKRRFDLFWRFDEVLPQKK